MIEKTIGNKWYKFDFHTHTPASSDYVNKTDSEIDWLKSLMLKEVDCVAVTDHVSGAWVDRLKIAYASINRTENWFRDLHIFPGVEITISTGIARVHLLAIFDPETDTAKINALLGKCGILEGHGDAESTTATESVENVINFVEGANGVVVAAHIDGPKGLLHNIKNTNPEIKRTLGNLIAAEFLDLNYLKREDINVELKSDAKHLAVVSGSDAHSIDSLGSRFTWVKMGNPSLASLKLALIDHIFCILTGGENPNVAPILYLNQLSIEKMQHCGRLPGKPEVFNLHPLFNAVIGGRGTGKSTLIESLRVSLSRVSELSDLPIIKQGVDSFISDVTSNDTVINLMLTRRNEKFKCVWKKGSPSKIYKLVGEEWVEDNGSPSERFGVSIYSQKQINALAGKPSSLLETIDRSHFVNYSSWKSKFDEQLTKLLICSHKIRELKKEVSSEGTLKANLDDINSDIESFEDGKHGEIFSKYQSTKDLKSRIDASANMDDLLAQFEILEKFSLVPLSLEHIADDNTVSLDKTEIMDIHNEFEREVNEIKNSFTDIRIRLQDALTERQNKISQTKWYSANQTIASEFESVAEDYQIRGESFDPNAYQEWLKSRDELREQLDLIDDAKDQLSESIKIKRKIVTKLFVMRRRLQRKRELFIKNVLGDNRYVKMTLKPFADTDSLESNFREILGLNSDSFSASIYQDGLNESLLSEIFKSTASVKEKIYAVSKVKNAVAKMGEGTAPEGFKVDARLITQLTNKMEVRPDILDRLDWWWPEDKLVVQYAKDPIRQNFENLEKGSAGQKAAAILAFLLSHGEDPIIVDQPEDDLDNALIYQLIVAELHKNKKRRQIIMVTHNPNIVVNGDAEMVNVLEYKGGQVVVADYGSLCDLQIRNQICNIMEGGKEAFEKRYKRIGLN